MRILLFIALAVSFSCSNKEYTKDECEILSMESYKGLPKKSHLFKKHCKNFTDLHYTKELCQKALGDLILNKSADYINKQYGPQIGHCFSKNDLKKFRQ